MSPLPRFALWILSLLLYGSALAQEDALPDPRLQKAVTYSAYSVTLQDAALALTKQTGVLIQAGAGSGDWRVKERRVHLYLRDIPLGRALSEIAETLGCTLRRSGEEGAWSYRIYQTEREKSEEEELAAALEAEQERKRQAHRDAAFRNAEEALALTPEAAAALKESRPWMAFLGGTEEGRAFAGLLLSLPPDAREAVRRGERVEIPFGDLTPSLKELALAALDDRNDPLPIPSAEPDAAEFERVYREIMDQLRPTRLLFVPVDPLTEGENSALMGHVGTFSLMAEMLDPNNPGDLVESGPSSMEGGTEMGNMSLLNADSPSGRIEGHMELSMAAGEDVLAAMESSDRMAEDPGFWEAASPEDAAPEPDDPALRKEVSPFPPSSEKEAEEIKTPPLKRLLEALAEQTGHTILVEERLSTDRVSTGLFIIPRKEPLFKSLNRLRLAGYAWEFERGVVRLRPVDWALQRRYAAPEAVLESYRKILTEKGWLNLDEVSVLTAALTDEQLIHRVANDETLRRALDLFSPLAQRESRLLLRFYAQMSPAQRAALRQPEGLSLAEVGDGPRSLIAGVIEALAPGEPLRGERVIFQPQNHIPSDSPAQVPVEMHEDAYEGAAEAPVIPDAHRSAFFPDEEDGPEEAGEAGEIYFTFWIETRSAERAEPRVLAHSFYLANKKMIERFSRMVEEYSEEAPSDENPASEPKGSREEAPESPASLMK